MKKARETGRAGKKNVPRVTKETATEKGAAFEKKVARWAKRHFDAAGYEIGTRFKGKTATLPFPIDIVFWLKDGRVLWIECKARKASIKRRDIWNLWQSAIDVKKAVPSFTLAGLSQEQRKMNWSYLIFVSTSRFDPDALKFAKEYNIGCYEYDGKTFQVKNKLS
ncbi:unnamed protein product [marine sediment metagenome]|uniref:Restriction endonuclease type IV Mrr domain-containing protein n=1 Tax=marine sediment metagenome TaxID=412755 RepID=X0SND3_9ZZZZ